MRTWQRNLVSTDEDDAGVRRALPEPLGVQIQTLAATVLEDVTAGTGRKGCERGVRKSRWQVGAGGFCQGFDFHASLGPRCVRKGKGAKATIGAN